VKWNYAVYILLLVVVGCRIALWAKFKGDDRGRRVGVSTLQLLIAIVAVAMLNWFPHAGWEVLLSALAGIVALSFVPAKKPT
jgi:hypothetical protein